ncbi:MAG: cytochrome C [Legionellales bacterium RIFCSPHIGHO2_12_FULL_35_11]|nr:MAG: cytochrome C [Legionellales bacterium RIFCSPHIGHO2_12_FULL_35_11]
MGVYSTTTLAEENKESAPILKLVDGYYPEYPATKPTDESKADLVKKGEYLSKIGDCISCHTNVKQRTPAYAGGLPIATPFGTFYSPNITPDKETGIGKWTKDDFLHALKHGKNPDGQNYFPVFPFVYFANITEEDSEALYEYLMSIPPVHQQNIPLPFPFNMPGARFSLLGWDLLFFYPNKVDTLYVPGQSEQWNRGRYIVDGLGHCSMCHTPLNPLGATKDKHYLTGAFIDDFWAPNITKLGLESASEQEVADIFKSNKLLHNAGPVAGPMAEVIHNSLKYLTDDDRMAISIYLKSVESEEYLGVPPSNNPPSLSRGRQVYLSACIECHQNGEMTAPIIGNSANWTNRLKEAGIEKLYKNVIYGYNSMPIKGACVTCSENDIISAVDYILDKSLSRSDKLSLEKEKTKLHPKTGKEIYDSNCAVCHNNGKDGAPKIGDTQIWNSKIKQNFDVLVKNTVFGNNHPKNGDCKTCNTGDIVEAIKYILKESNTDGDYNLW